MFEVKFYKNSAEPIVVDKTNQLGLVTTFVGTLRNSTSIVDPTIIFEFPQKVVRVVDDESNLVVDGDGLNVMWIDEPEQILFDCNYCYIPKFNRYYYITDVVSVRANLWEVSMKCDVLMSYKDIIRQQTCFVLRNEFLFNDFIVDNQVPSTVGVTPRVVLYKNKPVIKRGDITYEVDLTNAHYILTAFTTLDLGSSNEDLSLYFTPTITSATTVQFFNDYDNFQAFNRYCTTPNFFESLGDLFQNSSDYIVNELICPLPLKDIYDAFGSNNPIVGLGTYGDTLIGKALAEGAKSYPVFGSTRIRFWFDVLTEWGEIFDINKFYDKEPYSRYSIYLPFVGYRELPSQYLEQGLLNYIVYDVDIVTGDCLVTFSKTEPEWLSVIRNVPIFYEGNMYVELPFGRTNQSDIHRNTFLRNISFAQDLSNVVATSKVSGDIYRTHKKGSSAMARQMQGEAIQRGVEGMTNYLLGEIVDKVPVGSVVGQVVSSLKYRVYPSPYIIKYQPNFYYPDNYNHYYGKPICDTFMLSELSGFTEVGSVHLTGFTTATQDELSEIETLLLNGVIL